MTPPIDLVVTDLDGTLWEDERNVPSRTVSAWRRLAAARVPVLVATGRRVESTAVPLAAMGLTPPAVVLNGALGVHLHSGERFHLSAFSAFDASAVLQTFLDHDLHPCLYVDDDDHPVRLSATPSTHPTHIERFGAAATTADLLDAAGVESVLSFSVLGIDETAARAVGGALAEVAQAHVDRDRMYGGFAVTVAPPSQSKWNGVEAYCRAHGIDRARVLAMGDGANDLELLDGAAIAVVPEDGHAEAVARADHVIGRAGDGGWADVLGVLGLD